jgi:hypothetical protein
MRHPFDGVTLSPVEPKNHAQPSTSRSSPDGGSTRRSIFGALAAVFGATAGLLAAPRNASAQRLTTQALGEEGGGPRYRPYPPPGHGGNPPGRGRRGVTTYALGEEGGPYPPPYRGGRVTTHALGEEGGRPSRRRVTTFALGEEGGRYGY